MGKFDEKLGRLRAVLNVSSSLEAFQAIGLTKRELDVRSLTEVFPAGAFYDYAVANDLGSKISYVLHGKGAHIPEAPATGPSSPAPVRIPVAAQITRCKDGQPLVILKDRPFNGFEVRPGHLEHLGESLIAIARIAKQHRGKDATTVVMQ